MANAFFTGSGGEYTGGQLQDSTGGDIYDFNPSAYSNQTYSTPGIIGYQAATQSTPQNQWGQPVYGYDSSVYSSPQLAYLSILGQANGGKAGADTSKLPGLVSQLGLDPNALISAWQQAGTDPGWLSGPAGFLQAASRSYSGPNADALSQWVAANNNAVNSESNRSNAVYQAAHPQMSMTGTDYGAILAGMAGVGLGALGGAYLGATGAGAAEGVGAGMGESALAGAEGGLAGAGTGAGAGIGGEVAGAAGTAGAVGGSTDAIEALNTAMQLTGTDTATAAAQALGYGSTEEMLGAMNPNFLYGAGEGSFAGNLYGGDVSGSTPVSQNAPAQQAPSQAQAASPPKEQPNLLQLLSKMGNGVDASDIWNFIRANGGVAGSIVGGGGTGSQLVNLGSSLYGLYNSIEQKKNAQRLAEMADPMASQRAGYAQQLQALMANPSNVQSLPGYQAGLQAVQRSLAANGYLGSGNMMTALSNYGGTAFNNQAQLLAQLAGGSPGQAASLNFAGQQAGNQTLQQALAALGYGTRLFGL